MKGRALCRISVETLPESEEAVSGLLETSFSQPAVAYTNADTGRTVVSVYVPPRKARVPQLKRQIEAELQRIRSYGLRLGAGTIRICTLKPSDWAESWKRHFRPLSINSRLLVKPGWSKRRPARGQAVVVIDPGLSFGTGQHPTTFFCLQQLVQFRNASHNQAFLDVGTGSGILAIAAAKLGYRPVMGVDNDPHAVRIARANALKNGERSIRFRRQDVLDASFGLGPKASLICANLVSNVLVEAQKTLLARLEAGGTLVLAGILNREFSNVQRSFERAGLHLTQSRREGEWRSGSFR